ncbi:hypothetical protein F4677DRAFT_288758 [Hypoxylon crocopeplum]|nr:hypothetical protein F4677DRAFT_288758 [Hypoxylon crocopeplum]
MDNFDNLIPGVHFTTIRNRVPVLNEPRSPITYGVELQFLVPVLAASQTDPHPNETRKAVIVQDGCSYEDAVQIVAHTVLYILRAGAGVPAWTYLGPPYPTPVEVSMMDQESQAVSNMPDYSQWVVEASEDLVPLHDKVSSDYTWVGVKVKSSKRNSREASQFDQIGNVIKVLRSNLRMRLAPTTSLMVHAGERRRDIHVYTMGPKFLRVFCTLWWVLEKHILSLVHPSRLDHFACKPLTKYSRLSKMTSEELRDYLLTEGMHRGTFEIFYNQMHSIVPITSMIRRETDEIECIWRCVDAEEIAQKMEVDVYQLIKMHLTGRREPWLTWGRGSIGFQGFCEYAWPESLKKHNDGETGTIEFRSLQGTLDPLLIANWLAVVIRLYDFAHRGNTDDIMAIIQRSVASRYTCIDLLEDLGLPEQAKYFKKEIGSHTRDITNESMDSLFVGP